jgi:hypothetical protein
MYCTLLICAGWHAPRRARDQQFQEQVTVHLPNRRFICTQKRPSEYDGLRFEMLIGRIASLLARCATKANPAKAGDAKPRG